MRMLLFGVVVYGGCGIGMAFMAMNLGGTVLQASLSFTGAASGPLLGIFALGAFFPWANWIGAVVGSFFGLALPMWISIGAYSIGTPESLPTNTSLCQVEIVENGTITTLSSLTTTTETPPDEVTGIQLLYTVSYLWYPAIGGATVVLVGMVVSLLTGLTKKSDVDPKYLVPLFDRLFCCLPIPVRRWLRCYIDFQDPEDIKKEEKDEEFVVESSGDLNKANPVTATENGIKSGNIIDYSVGKYTKLSNPYNNSIDPRNEVTSTFANTNLAFEDPTKTQK